ncbi:MAG: hypothetical protein ACRDVG_01305 [Jatrophihabitantaceae bacterium]
MRSTSAGTRQCGPHPVPGDGTQDPPERLRVTATLLRAFRCHGWTVAERRSAGWTYLVARGDEQSAVYKLIGPRFDHGGAFYQAYRIA